MALGSPLPQLASPLLQRLLGLAAAGTLALACAAPAAAADWPARPVSVYVPVAAGGAADALARGWAAYAGKAIGGTVVVENKPGANGSIAAAYVAKQPADGYALLFGSTSNMSVNPFTYAQLAYDPTRDFDPVTKIAGTSQVLVANPGTGIRSVDDLVKQARANPGRLNYGSAGIGNSTHLNVAFLAEHFKLEMSHVPYKGAAPAMMDLIGGQIDLTSDALTGAVPQVKTGKAVPLVIFGTDRVAQFPDVPTIAEVGVQGFPGDAWYGLMAPKGTPPEIVQRLTEATRKFWADEAVRKQMDEIYMTAPKALGPESVAQSMKTEAEVWGPIVKRLGIRND
ncbi:Bug family tripartite tricarboxylate transporter substrate binding protein [Bordetella genomosp. 1]|uniref:Bug family tripartite tricarboxylate transporter substrate binding protein n=1 Tax=Bordetella genomosp. 1 TaxID=1395607 RepID=UPI00211B17DD|nr:tripartite tricarboxylate transporter substrate binding protein [Bordetella genomosp. 1]